MTARIRILVSLIGLFFITACAQAIAGEQVIKPPESTRGKEITQLAYVESFDGVSNQTFAVLAFVESDKTKGRWRVRIWSEGKEITGKTSLRPDRASFRKRMSEAAREGKDYFLAGNHREPTKNDPRLLENRVYFEEASMRPTHLELRLATRNVDGSAKDAKVVKVEWPKRPGDGKEEKPLVSTPKSDKKHKYEHLGYIHSYDVVSNKDYAFVVFKETELKTGEWRVRIRQAGSGGASLKSDHDALKKAIAEAAREGKTYVVRGYRMKAKPGDPRMFEFRLYFDKTTLNPSHLEIHLVTRNGDSSANEKKVLKVDWPA